MRKKSIFWGIVIILTAVGLIVSNLGYSLIIFGNLTTSQLIFTILTVYILYKGIAKKEVASIIFPLSFLVMIYKNEIGAGSLNNWLILLAALLLTIGIYLIFGHHHHININKNGFNATYDSDNEDGNFHFNSDEGSNNFKNDNGFINIEAALGSNVHYIENFSGGKIESALGNLQVYFTNAFMMSDSAELSIENALGTVNIYVPKTWKVNMNKESFAGSIKMFGKPSKNIEHTLNIHAENALGKITIEYIEM